MSLFSGFESLIAFWRRAVQVHGSTVHHTNSTPSKSRNLAYRKRTHHVVRGQPHFEHYLSPPAGFQSRSVVPKFIQSSYYEIFLAELFPQVEMPGIDASDGNEFRLAHLKSDNTSMTLDEIDSGPSRQYRANSLEEIRDNPEALAARIAQAVAAARKVAGDAAATVAAAEAVAAEVEEGGGSKVMHPSVR